jgi:hypothetical protein
VEQGLRFEQDLAEEGSACLHVAPLYRELGEGVGVLPGFHQQRGDAGGFLRWSGS